MYMFVYISGCMKECVFLCVLLSLTTFSRISTKSNNAAAAAAAQQQQHQSTELQTKSVFCVSAKVEPMDEAEDQSTLEETGQRL